MTIVNKKIDSDLLQVLQDFGLTLYQAKVYLVLLELGATTAGPIVRKVGFHRQLVYSALEILETNQMVFVSSRNNRKIFVAAKPEVLVEKQLERMRKVQLALPKLKKLSPKASDQVNVEVLAGKDGFLRRLFLLIDSAARTDKVLRVVADVRDVDVYGIIGDSYKDYYEYSRKNKVKKRLIAPNSSATNAYRDKLTKEVGSELRISNESLSIPTATAITSEVVVFDIFSEEVTSVLIWNQTLAKSYLKNFEILWKAATPWKRV